ncbi:hypothetical protein ONS95_010103 [Cadophora gregata]|uniref:uncharacterized protein n=1 Tax=Cadophora gregata TaxID=51156 RepID=UPI0026DDB19A|nr:uncharacterized protein ONS95_010103 [Cadophora gregata]KAK0121821.1 hypothetical protein ONS95_010103 [Cadophora gregata]
MTHHLSGYLQISVAHACTTDSEPGSMRIRLPANHGMYGRVLAASDMMRYWRLPREDFVRQQNWKREIGGAHNQIDEFKTRKIDKRNDGISRERLILKDRHTREEYPSRSVQLTKSPHPSNSNQN